jgi:hypothetical protein
MQVEIMLRTREFPLSYKGFGVRNGATDEAFVGMDSIKGRRPLRIDSFRSSSVNLTTQ